MRIYVKHEGDDVEVQYEVDYIDINAHFGPLIITPDHPDSSRTRIEQGDDPGEEPA